MINLSNRPTSSPSLDLSVIKFSAQQHLFKLLDKFEGTKTIVWDDKLIGPFEFVANASLLREHDAVKLFRLSDLRITLTTDYILYFLRKDYQVAKQVADVLLRFDKASLSKMCLVFVPQRCYSIEKLLTQHKIDLDRLCGIEELNIELFVLDTDIFSMENEFVYRDMYLNQDFSALHQIVESLVRIQDVYGQIPCITGLGKGAKTVCDLLLKRRKIQPKPERTASQINQLILIDRRIDLVTPLLTQLTYEGLLDEVFGINHGTIALPRERFLSQQEQKLLKKNPQEKLSENKKFELKSSEELFAKLRDCHINAIGQTFKQSAKNLQAEYEECKSEGKTIHEMGKIVKRLNHLKMAKTSQSNHVTIAELLNEQTLKPEFIIGLRIEHDFLQEEKINRLNSDIEMKLMRQENPYNILRLISLQSIINNGLKPKICDYYKREILQNYGIDYLLLLMQLEKANILLSHEKFHDSKTFTQIKTRLGLINDNVDDCNPNHFSYVYGGYAPISVMVAKTLTQFTHSHQWRLLSDNLKLIAEPLVTHSSSLTTTLPNLSHNMELSGASLTSGPAPATSSFLLSSAAFATEPTSTTTRVRRNSVTSSHSSSEESRIVLVFFIGGCTFAEISALRFLTQQEENNCEFVIGTTKILNGKTFLKSLWPRMNKATPA